MKDRIQLDPYPIPKEESPLFINESWLVDASIDVESSSVTQPETENDNRRVYIPLDLNKKAILRRLDEIIRRYGVANERNEMDFSLDVRRLLYQVDIYDHIWFVRHMPGNGKHSHEGTSLIQDFVKRLEEIPDECAECFPFEMIEELRNEYLIG